MREKFGIESSKLLPYRSADHQAGSRNPEHPGGSVILTFVFFHSLEHAAPAVRKTVTVEPSAGGAGILEAAGALVAPFVASHKSVQLRSAGAALRMALHPRREGLQPVGADFYVGIEQHVVLRTVNLCQGLVVAPGKAEILPQRNLPHVGVSIRRCPKVC